MRVIAGSAKGVRLAPAPEGVRPLSDRAREGLFSSIGAAVEGARVLDLYAGTGAVGIEALSRGAEAATLVDRHPAAVRAIRENLGRTHLAARATVVRAAALRFVRRDGKIGGPFDVVFLDPPYAEEAVAVSEVLEALGGGWLAGHGWTVVLTRGRRSSTPVIPLDWLVARRLEYGDSLVLVYREV